MTSSSDPDGTDQAVSEAATEAPEPGAAAGVGPRGSWLRIALLAVLLVALVASAATLTVTVLDRRDDDDLQSQRDQVMAQTRQFALRINTYGPELLGDDGKTMPEYRELCTEVMTAKFGQDLLESGIQLAEQSVAQAGVGRSAKVYAAGVSALSDDRATALVALEFTTSYPDPDDEEERINDVPLPLRWEVTLLKVDGEWLVDDYEPVTGEAQ
ncbi:hypothetical protein [Nocardioides sp. SYSU D00038]|uniref:hypothetical protein n=1 Tax=Nocardioides sp. SYSU D00038 TaxID=2812554 RepID=UPI0019678B76|nr:hypothetical protein [Nocardioides sp. SYSU D00038]